MNEIGVTRLLITILKRFIRLVVLVFAMCFVALLTMRHFSDTWIDGAKADLVVMDAALYVLGKSGIKSSPIYLELQDGDPTAEQIQRLKTTLAGIEILPKSLAPAVNKHREQRTNENDSEYDRRAHILDSSYGFRVESVPLWKTSVIVGSLGWCTIELVVFRPFSRTFIVQDRGSCY